MTHQIKMKELTRAEEQVMQVMWSKGKCTVKEILSDFPDPQPAINTVSTIVRILETKGFVEHEKFGKGFIYYPLIEKADYTKKYLKNFMKNYFSGSFRELVSFFAKESDMDIEDIDLLLKEVKNDLKDENSQG